MQAIPRFPKLYRLAHFTRHYRLEPSFPHGGKYPRRRSIQEDIYLVEDEVVYSGVWSDVLVLLDTRFCLPRNVVLQLDFMDRTGQSGT